MIYIAHVRALPGCNVGMFSSKIDAILACFLRGYRVNQVFIEEIKIDEINKEKIASANFDNFKEYCETIEIISTFRDRYLSEEHF